MKKQYIKPMIEVVPQQYNEGLMQEWSSKIGSGGGTVTPPPPAKPGGEWGDVWSEPVTDDDDWG